ncbi:MAG TPA: ATP-binding protein, partial [Burkholderiaceae bacterium]|nr:ATP-binding protein [Burkholderiaceae bacterium]
ERRRQEAALERNRALLRAVLDADADCIYAKDAAGRFGLVNRAFLLTFGLREENVLGRTSAQVFPDTPLLERSIAEDEIARRSGQPTVVEQRLDLARPLGQGDGAAANAGGNRNFVVTRQSITGPDGAAWLLGVARDVTELRRQEAMLTRQQQFMREVIDLDTNLIFVRDARMRYVMVNLAYAALFGRNRDEMVGLTPWDLFENKEQVDRAIAADRRVIEQGIEVTQEDLFTFSGEDRYYLAVKKPIVGPDGEVGILAIVRDITELRRGEERLRAAAQAAQTANEAKSRFLTNMSHEIRTPINGILGMIDLALRTESLREQRQYLDLAQSSAEALLAIVNDVLDFSKIEAGGMTVETVPFSLYDLINDVTKPLALKANEKRLDFFNRVSPHLPLCLLGDPTRLRQVLMNLIGNAIKFTSSGEVMLEVESTVPPDARRDDDRLPIRFVVRDSGAGISREQQAKIFEAFTQVDTSAARRFGGAGLGLAISARLVQLMGGKLEVDSELGSGSRFWFVLNLPFERGASGAATPTYRHFPELNALWIDPHASSRAWFTHVLRLWDVQAVGAASVGDVLRAPAGTRYDVVFLDGIAVAAAGPRLQDFLGTLHGTYVFALLAGQETVPPVLRDALGERCAALLKPISPLDLHRALSQTAGVTAESFEATGEPLDDERPFEGLRVLLAEDNYVNRVLAVAVLERLGARLQLAEQGAEALGLMKQAEFDVVLMDVQMPVMDGVEAVRRWRQIERADPQARRVPVIAMTAHALSGDRERFLDAGFDGYISKPFRESDLVGEVLRLLAPVRAARV